MLPTPKVITNNIMAFFIWISAILVLMLFIFLTYEIIINGNAALSWDFIFLDPQNAGREGGIFPIIVSTFLILLICLLVSLPLSLGSAIYLSEYSKVHPRFSRLIVRSLDVLASVPSIVFGLFGNVFFAKVLGLGFSLVSGGLTLSCMVLPLMIRATEAGFRQIPVEYRLSAHALALSNTTTLRKILIPQALPGIMAGFVLGVGRALAETAALIFTSGYVDRLPESLLDSGRSLSIHIYDLSMNVTGGNQNAYKSAFVLMMMVLVINLISSFIVNKYFSKGDV